MWVTVGVGVALAGTGVLDTVAVWVAAGAPVVVADGAVVGEGVWLWLGPPVVVAVAVAVAVPVLGGK